MSLLYELDSNILFPQVSPEVEREREEGLSQVKAKQKILLSNLYSLRGFGSLQVRLCVGPQNQLVL